MRFEDYQFDYRMSNLAQLKTGTLFKFTHITATFMMVANNRHFIIYRLISTDVIKDLVFTYPNGQKRKCIIGDEIRAYKSTVHVNKNVQVEAKKYKVQ